MKYDIYLILLACCSLEVADSELSDAAATVVASEEEDVPSMRLYLNVQCASDYMSVSESCT